MCYARGKTTFCFFCEKVLIRILRYLSFEYISNTNEKVQKIKCHFKKCLM